MVDRGTGDVWALLSDPEGERIRLVSPPPPGFRGHVYEAFSGPTLSAGGYPPVRLFVRDGGLGFEVYDHRVQTRPIYAPERVRARFTDTFYEVVVPEGFNPSTDALAYETEVTFS